MRILIIAGGTALVASVIFSFLADQLLAGRIAILGSFAGFQLSHNPGIAFGLRLPPVAQELLIGIALIIVAIIAIRHARHPQARYPQASRPAAAATLVAFGLILGGGIANIVDRIPDGLVTDFIQIGTFPTFNVADSCITVGAILLILESFIRSRRER
ncbi:MAG: signal peptidase II [Patescibacteria group bacterium]